MGSPKALLDYRGRTFIENICTSFLTAGVDELIVVLGAHEHEAPIRAVVPKHPALRTVVNPQYRLGQLSSLQVGIQSLSSESEAAVVNLVDHPLIRPETIQALMASFATDPLPIIIASYQGPPRPSGAVRKGCLRRAAGCPLWIKGPRWLSAKTRIGCVSLRSTIPVFAPISIRLKSTPGGLAHEKYKTISCKKIREPLHFPALFYSNLGAREGAGRRRDDESKSKRRRPCTSLTMKRRLRSIRAINVLAAAVRKWAYAGRRYGSDYPDACRCTTTGTGD